MYMLLYTHGKQCTLVVTTPNIQHAGMYMYLRVLPAVHGVGNGDGVDLHAVGGMTWTVACITHNKE